MLKKLIDRVRRGPKYRYRSSVTGRYVPYLYALLNPQTTYRETQR